MKATLVRNKLVAVSPSLHPGFHRLRPLFPSPSPYFSKCVLPLLCYVFATCLPFPVDSLALLSCCMFVAFSTSGVLSGEGFENASDAFGSGQANKNQAARAAAPAVAFEDLCDTMRFAAADDGGSGGAAEHPSPAKVQFPESPGRGSFLPLHCRMSTPFPLGHLPASLESPPRKSETALSGIKRHARPIDVSEARVDFLGRVYERYEAWGEGRHGKAAVVFSTPPKFRCHALSSYTRSP